jgi:hypothetical protein
MVGDLSDLRGEVLVSGWSEYERKSIFEGDEYAGRVSEDLE